MNLTIAICEKCGKIMGAFTGSERDHSDYDLSFQCTDCFRFLKELRT